MAPLPVSVIVVSRHRPAELARCLTGLSRLAYDLFEVVVVACPQGAEVVRRSALATEAKLVEFDRANISVARNRGVAVAAGEIVAFIDDDAVPETAWLTHLARPFAQDRVAAATGFVRGRNGITFQSRAAAITPTGDTVPLEVDPQRTTLLTGAPGRGIKTVGTNMAFRRSELARIGGFDPAFAFYLDEADVNMRLARAGAVTAVVPLAEVHHGYAASALRRADRTPRDLYEIGASLSAFLLRHCPQDSRDGARARFRAERRRWLLEHMVTGRLDPAGVRRLLRRLDHGLAQGLMRPGDTLPPIPHPPGWFRPVPPRLRGAPVVLRTKPFRRHAIRAQARALARQGRPVTLLDFSLSALFHKVSMEAETGLWRQAGGLWGRSDRSDRLLRLWTPAARQRRELARITRQRWNREDA
ncbi:glycosyltransferase family 2 protein [Pseudooceanicola aestuarii]|uniref:glycosyltransferase family 2 protein n=1 Tax=Pseudooceanicola aestuarii TaxID=2697319 RepID=UPI0013CF4F4B|nr:glycosyltransferase [Pseudooceanicola aestuarii]